MSFLFVDDGYPEATEYSNNYVFYDPADPNALWRALAQVARRKSSEPDPARRPTDGRR